MNQPAPINVTRTGGVGGKVNANLSTSGPSVAIASEFANSQVVGAGATVTDGGAIKFTFDLIGDILKIQGERDEINAEAVSEAQAFARNLGKDFLSVNLDSGRTESAQLASQRNQLLRSAIPWIAAAFVGYAFFRR